MKKSKSLPPDDAEVTAVDAVPAAPIQAAGTVLSLPSPATDALAAGVEAARRIEESTDRIRRARAHAKRARRSRPRQEARRQLRRLLRTLHTRQETVLSQGIAPEDHHTLVAHLHAIDRAIDEFLAIERLKKSALKHIRKVAKTLRKAL